MGRFAPSRSSHISSSHISSSHISSSQTTSFQFSSSLTSAFDISLFQTRIFYHYVSILWVLILLGFNSCGFQPCGSHAICLWTHPETFGPIDCPSSTIWSVKFTNLAVSGLYVSHPLQLQWYQPASLFSGSQIRERACCQKVTNYLFKYLLFYFLGQLLYQLMQFND